MTAAKQGGYRHRQAIRDGRQACRTARQSLEELITQERPGPALTALLVARIGTALAAIQESFNELEHIKEET
jgi:hypothetical protein